MKISIYGFGTTRRFAAIAIVASFIFSNVFAIDALRRDDVSAKTISATTAKYTTDLTQVEANLAASGGSGDGQADAVLVNTICKPRKGWALTPCSENRSA